MHGMTLFSNIEQISECLCLDGIFVAPMEIVFKVEL